MPTGSPAPWNAGWSFSFSLSTTRSAMARECRTLSWVLKNWRSRIGLPVWTSASVTVSDVGFGGMTCSCVRAW